MLLTTTRSNSCVTTNVLFRVTPTQPTNTVINAILHVILAQMRQNAAAVMSQLALEHWLGLLAYVCQDTSKIISMYVDLVFKDVQNAITT